MKKSAFQFLDPILIKLQFEQLKNVSQEKEVPESEENTVEVNTKQASDEPKAIVEVEVRIKSSSYCLTARIGSVFEWEKGLEDSKVENLLRQNAPALLVSYLRPIVANVTMASKREVCNIPFLDFTDNT